MPSRKPLTTIGRAETISLPELGAVSVPAKIDTGADMSSLWVSRIQKRAHGLSFKLFGPSSKLFTGEIITIPDGEYELTRIANSFGTKELRYVIKLRVEVKGRKVRTVFSLANRSQKTYPVLLGRRLLKGKFLVDVSQGHALLPEEAAGRAKLARDLRKYKN